MKISAALTARLLPVFAASLLCFGCASAHRSISQPNKEASNVVSDERIKEKLKDVMEALRDLEETRKMGVGPPPQRTAVLESFLKDLHNDPTRKKDAQALLDSAQRYLSDLGKEMRLYSDINRLDWFPEK